MRSSNVLFLALLILLVAGCGGGSSDGGIVGGGGGSGSGGTKTLVSIAITPSNPFIAVATTQQFTATGTYSDNTTQNLTASVTWSSSNTGVATIVGSTGLATPVAVGSTTITAALGGISGSTTLTVTANNVLAISVKDSPSLAFRYPNKPTVSVTICTPGTSTCQTVDDILLDTGSSGLRLFSQVLTVPLAQVSAGSGSLAECVQFVDNTADWGPVQMADVILGGEPAVSVPVHVFNAAFGTVPSSCGTPEAGPASAGYNGILGVGLFAQDCGAACVSNAKIWYYSCSGTNCTGTTVPLTNQVQNPVALLPVDNNGVLVQLPAIPAGGAPSVTGSLILGIGTQTNNIPSGVTTYPADPTTGDFSTNLNGTGFPNSFIDSGSNGLFFDEITPALAAQLPTCASPNASWFCPPSTVSLTATNSGYQGSPSGPVSFQIGNSTTLFSSGNNAFAELGGPAPSGFDWGMPFFYGRRVFVGIKGKASSLWIGPYWAY